MKGRVARELQRPGLEVAHVVSAPNSLAAFQSHGHTNGRNREAAWKTIAHPSPSVPGSGLSTLDSASLKSHSPLGWGCLSTPLQFCMAVQLEPGTNKSFCYYGATTWVSLQIGSNISNFRGQCSC